jgi:hypothetical protein
MRLRSAKSPDLVEEAAEACRGTERFEATHGPGPLLDAPMVLFQMVV